MSGRLSMPCRVAAILGVALLSVVRAASPKADAVVAADGSGEFRSVQEAISAAPMRTAATDPSWVIFVKAGTYRERVYVQRERGNITVRGEDEARTFWAGRTRSWSIAGASISPAVMSRATSISSSARPRPISTAARFTASGTATSPRPPRPKDNRTGWFSPIARSRALPA